jgi:hypothetical protein
MVKITIIGFLSATHTYYSSRIYNAMFQGLIIQAAGEDKDF